MKTIKPYLLLLTLLVLGGCSKFFDPMIDNVKTEDDIFKTKTFFNGLLMQSYSILPVEFEYRNDNMTDNAVLSDMTDNMIIASTGGLQPNNNPLACYGECYTQLRKINQYIAKMVFDPSKPVPTPIRFVLLHTKEDSIDNSNEFYRLLGEAYFMRAWWQAKLLRTYGGVSADGQVLGFQPVGDKVLTINDNLQIPRAPYDECVEMITADLDTAIKYLPLEYKGPSRIYGEILNGAASGIAAKALRARVLLYAASPSINRTNDPERWEAAALAAADAINSVGGLLKLSTQNEYYFTALNDGKYQNRDIIFRVSPRTNRGMENNNYPVSMYGKASTNPTQNFVDAFPDQDGYPISESSLYNEEDPYNKRDPRLKLYVAHNGSTMGPKNYYTIASYKGGPDAYNPTTGTSRTSYYLRKLLRPETVNLTPTKTTSTARACILLGMPELYLSFAEAANEAWGVKADPKGVGFTAYDALIKIQERVGASPKYLNNVIGTDADKFRTYIRNERRLELSFEDQYFYDLRRWIGDMSTATLNIPVYGMELTLNSDGSYSYNKVLLETKKFKSPYMPYSYVDLANSPTLKQNYGWE